MPKEKPEEISTQQPEAYIKVGKVHSTQGLKGEVFLMIFSGEFDWQDRMGLVHLGEKGSEEPADVYSVERKRDHQKQKHRGLAVKLQGVDVIETAETLVGRPFFIPESFLSSEDGESIYLREIEGFQVVDETRGDVGTVVDFMDNGAQDLIVVKHASGERFEVPLVEPILQRIDFQKKFVLMDIPQGLVAGEDL